MPGYHILHSHISQDYYYYHCYYYWWCTLLSLPQPTMKHFICISSRYFHLNVFSILSLCTLHHVPFTTNFSFTHFLLADRHYEHLRSSAEIHKTKCLGMEIIWMLKYSSFYAAVVPCQKNEMDIKMKNKVMMSSQWWCWWGFNVVDYDVLCRVGIITFPFALGGF